MSQPSSPLTPEQIEQMRRIAAEIASQRTAEPAATPQPWKLKVGDSELEARDASELQRLLDERSRQSDAALEAERVRTQAAQQQLEDFQRAQAAAQRPAQPVGDNFDKEEYAKLFLDDPRKANAYLLQRDPGMQQLFGAIGTKIQQLESTLEQERQERSAERFMSQNSDYQATPENFATIESIIAENNLPWTDASLGLAWAYAKEQGKAKLSDSDNRMAQAPTPPSLGRRSSSQVEPDDIIDQFSGWPAERQKQYLESLTRA